MAVSKEIVSLVFEAKDSGVKSSIKETKAGVSSLSVAIGNIGSNLATGAITKGFQAIQSSIIAVKDTAEDFLKTSMQFEDNFRRLETALKASGTSWDEQASKMEQVQQKMYDYAGTSEDQIIGSLASMLIYTNDVEKAYDSLNAVYDIAGSKMMDLATAERAVGMAWGGNGMTLARYIPALRGLTAEQFKSGEFLKHLNNLQGQATAATNTLSGSVETLLGQYGMLQNVLAKDSRDALIPAIGKLTEKVREFAQSGEAKEMGTLLGDITQNLMGAASVLMGGNGMDGVVDGINNFLSAISGYTGSGKFTEDINSIKDALAGVLNVLKGIKAVGGPVFWAFEQIGHYSDFENVKADVAGRANEAAGIGQPYAAGGRIPGTFAGDKIPFIGRGEYIVNPDATAEFEPLLNYLNFVAKPSTKTGAGYSSGGMFGDHPTSFGRDFGSYAWDWAPGGAMATKAGSGKGTPNIEEFIKRLQRQYGSITPGFNTGATELWEAKNAVKGDLTSAYLTATNRLYNMQHHGAVMGPNFHQNRRMWEEVASWAKKYTNSQNIEAGKWAGHEEGLGILMSQGIAQTTYGGYDDTYVRDYSTTGPYTGRTAPQDPYQIDWERVKAGYEKSKKRTPGSKESGWGYGNLLEAMSAGEARTQQIRDYLSGKGEFPMPPNMPDIGSTDPNIGPRRSTMTGSPDVPPTPETGLRADLERLYNSFGHSLNPLTKRRELNEKANEYLFGWLYDLAGLRKDKGALFPGFSNLSDTDKEAMSSWFYSNQSHDSGGIIPGPMGQRRWVQVQSGEKVESIQEQQVKRQAPDGVIKRKFTSNNTSGGSGSASTTFNRQPWGMQVMIASNDQEQAEFVKEKLQSGSEINLAAMQDRINQLENELALVNMRYTS